MGLDCSKTINKVPSRFMYLTQTETRDAEFTLLTNSESGLEHQCKIQIKNAIGEIVATETVIFRTKELQEVYVEDETYENYEEDKVIMTDASAGGRQDYSEFDEGVICNFLCPMMTNLFCFVVTGCFKHMIMFLYTLGVVVAVLVGVSLGLYCFCCRKKSKYVKKESGKENETGERQYATRDDNERVVDVVDKGGGVEKQKLVEDGGNMMILEMLRNCQAKGLVGGGDGQMELLKVLEQMRNAGNVPSNPLCIEDERQVERRKRKDKRKRKAKRQKKRKRYVNSESESESEESESSDSSEEESEIYETPLKLKKKKKPRKKRKQKNRVKQKKTKGKNRREGKVKKEMSDRREGCSGDEESVNDSMAILLRNKSVKRETDEEKLKQQRLDDVD